MTIRFINMFSALATLTLLTGPFVAQQSLANSYSTLGSTSEDLIQAPLFIPGPTYSGMVKELKRIISKTESMSPDPIGQFRQELEVLLLETSTDKEGKLYERLLEFYRIFEPEKADPTPIDPHQEYLKELRKRIKLNRLD